MITEFIVKWFTEHSGEGEDIRTHLTDNYLTGGYIDSFGFLELISCCEEKYGFSFSDEDFENDRIFSIEGLSQVIKNKIGEPNE